MTWNQESETMAVNVIAKVEGGGAWDAINYNDPITLGLMQWFGTRAANLLVQIKADHPTDYAGIAASVRSDMDSHAATSRWWTSRYLTRSEGNTIKPVLRASHDTQGELVRSDVIDYKAVAERIGMNPDTNTNSVIYFMCMYHQSPARAINLMKVLGMNSSLDRVHAGCLNEGVLGRYKTRYNQAYTIIKSGVPPEIIDLNDDDAEGGDGGGSPGPGGGGSITNPGKSGVVRIEKFGDNLIIHYADGGTQAAAATGGNNFLLAAKKEGVEVPDATPGEGESDSDWTPDPSADTKQKKLVQFMVDRIGRYGYSQGPGRLKPDQSGVADCSSITRYAYLTVTGKDIGTYTDAQVTNTNTRIIETGGGGNSPTESKLELGDLIISARGTEGPGRFASHVEMYMGNGKIIGHGGPMKGPIVKDLVPRTADKTKWWVKRLKGL